MNIAETAAQLQTIQQAIILIHQSPDGDCIGSGYALAALLRQMGCHAVVRCSDPIPERYAFLAVEETPDTVDEDAAVILSVDVADRKLLGDLDEPYGGRVALAIDHHIMHRSFAKACCLRNRLCDCKGTACETHAPDCHLLVYGHGNRYGLFPVRQRNPAHAPNRCRPHGTVSGNPLCVD